MKVGEYFRTPWGNIGKITNIPKHDKYQDDGFYLNSKFVMCGREAMKKLKSTPNIIDLIEVGDYVNGQKVFDKLYDELNKCWYLKLEIGEVFGKYARTYQQHIKSIVTKEQFESMEYKVGD